MIDNKGDIQVTTSRVIWPAQALTITATLFDVDDSELNLSFEDNDNEISMMIGWQDSTVGVSFDISANGTIVYIIDGCDDDFNPTIDAATLDLALTDLLA